MTILVYQDSYFHYCGWMKELFEHNIAAYETLAREVLGVDLATLQLAKDALLIIEQQLKILRNSGAANHAYQSIQNSTLDNGV